MKAQTHPLLKGGSLFREGELVYINKSDELEQYCNIIHKHDFIEIAYVVSGTGRHVVGDHEYETCKGDLFIINYDVPHGFFPLQDTYGSQAAASSGPIVYNCVFMPHYLDISLISSTGFQDIASSFLFKSLFQQSPLAIPDLKLQGADFHEIGELFGKMYTEYKFMRKGYCEIIRGYLIELIVKIFRHLDAASSRPVSIRNRELVDKAIFYLKSNYSSDVKLEDLALKSFISKNYFSRLFKEVTGTNFSDYIQKIRIDEACSLLRSTDCKIVDIASQVGFNDIKFFYEVFRKITGKTPGDFRKS